jgi:hypothetical protein
MRPLLVAFGVIMIGSGGYSALTERTVPGGRGWKPGEQPSVWMRWVGLSSIVVGIWVVVAPLIGIPPPPPFSRL